MKKIILSLVTMLTLEQALALDDCFQAIQGTAETLRSYQQTVSQCLNRFEPGLSTTFENLVEEFAGICQRKCASEGRRQCARAVEAKNRLKEVSPIECR